MAIKIIEEPAITVTRSEYNRLVREYNDICRYMVNPPSFEEFVQSKKDGRRIEHEIY